jgi:hypothetical protein
MANLREQRESRWLELRYGYDDESCKLFRAYAIAYPIPSPELPSTTPRAITTASRTIFWLAHP